MKKENSLRQFIIFGIIGLTNTIISYLIYIIFLVICEKYHIFDKYDYILGSILGFLVSVAWSFYWNNRVTFKNHNKGRSLWRALLKTYISYGLTGLIINNILLFVLVIKFGIAKQIAPLICLVITVPLNYVLNKYWAFRESK